MNYTAANLIIHPSPGDVIVEVDPATAGWDFVHFQARRMRAGDSLPWNTDRNELALVMLGGVCSVTSNRGAWEHVGGRANVFAGLPHALYLPRATDLTIKAETDCEIALAWCVAEQACDPVLVTPEDIAVEIRGGDNATRQINSIIPPGFACQRLVVVEVYTPSGNWSSYPPHKHDTDDLPNEALLEETYYHRLRGGSGFAFQRVYTDDGALDEAVVVRDGDVVRVPRGYHPVAGDARTDLYYLNVMAGPVRAWRVTVAAGY